MENFVLLTLTIVFAVSTVSLALILLEAWRPATVMILRKWRYVLSKRRQINAALTRQARAERLRDAAVRDSNQAEQKAELAERDAAHRVKVAEQEAAQKVQRAEEEMRVAGRYCKERLSVMGSYIITEQCGEHIKAIRANNYHAKEKKILRSIKVASKNGYDLPEEDRKQLSRMLKQAHEDAIRAEQEKQRQAEIKAQIREEERRQREIEREIKKAEKEEQFKRKALEEAIRLLGDTHSEELEKLKAELAEAQAATERTKSMAEQTKSGHIYVISNIGSFGRDVFKVGMTRRLEPMDRVRELGDASVPFSFDVHAMISSDDAPALEAALHRDLGDYRVNKVNLRKEFFRVDISTIIDAVGKHHGEVTYEADPEALEYLESLEKQEAWDGDLAGVENA